MRLLSFFLFIFLSVQSTACEYGKAATVVWDIPNTMVVDSIFYQAQDKIYGAFAASLAQENSQSIDEIINQLQQNSAKAPNLGEYWLAYAHYYKAIYYISYSKDTESEKAIKKGIEYLDEKKTKNAEDLALLALMQSFSVQFAPGMSAAIISNKSKSNIAKALEMEPGNLRAYYVAGSIDYYTPKQYGGGKKVEEYLKKALQQPVQKNKNPYLPSWGKEETYVMIAEYYLEYKRKNDALNYYKEGIQLFPNSYQLGELAKKLI
jgi:tetratricopeptide (TPR) repeat protein